MAQDQRERALDESSAKVRTHEMDLAFARLHRRVGFPEIWGMRHSVLFPYWPIEAYNPRWNSHQVGLWGERAVARHYWRRGHRILAHRWLGPDDSDIDLVVASDEILVFVEVKVRSAGNTEDDDPWSEVYDRDRQRRLLHAAGSYLAKSGQVFVDLRFDACLVTPDRTNPRSPRLQTEEGYLNPAMVPGWRGVRQIE